MRFRYIDAIRWIANNDNPAEEDPVERVADYMTVLLVADLYEREPAAVARDVVAERDKEVPF